ncbi:MAG: hypothetical protein PUB21_03790 [Bacteroidales bacterium]|nr:hypothetical protein [Bacteroidales bacterium]
MKFYSYNHFLNNQGLGYLPVLLLTLLFFWLPYKEALLISWLSVLCMVGIFQFFSGRMIYQFFLTVSVIILLAYSSLLLLLPQQNILFEYSPLLLEMLSVLILVLVSLFRNVIERKVVSRTAGVMLVPVKNTLYEFFLVAQILQNFLTLHLFCLFFASLLPSESIEAIVSGPLYKVTLVGIPFLAILYEHFRLTVLSWQLKKEKWLPIVDSKGNVVGIVAETEKDEIASEYRLPMVRTILMYDNQILLVPTEGKAGVDTPLSVYVTYGSSIAKTQMNSLHEIGLKFAKKSRFLMTYLYDQDRERTVNSLYIHYITNEKIFKKISIPGAKLWSQKQIEENLGKNYFTKCFEKEYELFSNTIFLPEISSILQQD